MNESESRNISPETRPAAPPRQILNMRVPGPLGLLLLASPFLLAFVGLYFHIRAGQSVPPDFDSLVYITGSGPDTFFMTSRDRVDRDEFQRACDWVQSQTQKSRFARRLDEAYVFLLDDKVTVEYPWVYTDGQPYQAKVTLKATGKVIGQFPNQSEHVTMKSLILPPEGPAFLKNHLKAMYRGNPQDAGAFGEFSFPSLEAEPARSTNSSAQQTL